MAGRKRQRSSGEIRLRRKRRKVVLLSILGAIVLAAAVIMIVSAAGVSANMKIIEQMPEVGSGAVPELDPESGNWTFTTDGELRVLQLSDIHIGGGAFSITEDRRAIEAVYTLIANEKPDLVIATGHIAFPVPYQAGTINNKREAELFAALMEKCGVYWTVVFGNHDTEAYSLYDREAISEFYSDERFSHCLYQAGPEDVDGYGNAVIDVKNSAGAITRSLLLFDSHSYTDGDIFGIEWKYDNIHQNQIDWYSSQIERANSANAAIGGTSPVKSSLFFHIPLEEYRDAWNEYVDAGHGDTENVKYNFGAAGESGDVVFCGMHSDELFETALALGSTDSIFCGHDHLNYFSLNYKGIDLNYGMSIDNLAYVDYFEQTEQRGGTLITYAADGSMRVEQRRLVDY